MSRDIGASEVREVFHQVDLLTSLSPPPDRARPPDAGLHRHAGPLVTHHLRLLAGRSRSGGTCGAYPESFALFHSIDCLQMVWENGCTVIVMLTALVEDGEKQCDRYWPDEGSSLYHIYEVTVHRFGFGFALQRRGTFDLRPFDLFRRPPPPPTHRSTWCRSTSGATTSWCAAST